MANVMHGDIATRRQDAREHPPVSRDGCRHRDAGLHLQAARGFVAQFAGPDQGDLRWGAYGAPVAVPQAALLLDRVVGLADVTRSGQPIALAGLVAVTGPFGVQRW